MLTATALIKSLLTVFTIYENKVLKKPGAGVCVKCAVSQRSQMFFSHFSIFFTIFPISTTTWYSSVKNISSDGKKLQITLIAAALPPHHHHLHIFLVRLTCFYRQFILFISSRWKNFFFFFNTTSFCHRHFCYLSASFSYRQLTYLCDVRSMSFIIRHK